MILGGDIGGTKTLLALADSTGIVFEHRYPSRDWSDFPALLRAFHDEVGVAGGIASACFGVAGPVQDNRAKVTYLPWTIDGPALSREFKLDRVEVVNDFAAAAQASAQVGQMRRMPPPQSKQMRVGGGMGRA